MGTTGESGDVATADDVALDVGVATPWLDWQDSARRNAKTQSGLFALHQKPTQSDVGTPLLSCAALLIRDPRHETGNITRADASSPPEEWSWLAFALLELRGKLGRR